MVEEQVTEVKPKEKPKKKKPELKKAKETKEKVKTERVKIDKKEVRKEKLVPKEQPEEKSVVKNMLIINVLYIKRYNYNGYLIFRKIVDVEETQVLETTEIIEEQPTEVNTTIKYIYSYVRWYRKFLNNLRLMESHLNFNNLASTILI